MGLAMKPALVLILGRAGKGNLGKLVFELGLSAVVRERMQDALDRLRRGGFAAILVDQDHVEVDVLEFVLNVRDIDKHVPVFVVGRSQDDNAEKTATVLHATSFLDKSEVREKLAEELEKVLSNEQRAGPEQD